MMTVAEAFWPLFSLDIFGWQEALDSVRTVKCHSHRIIGFRMGGNRAIGQSPRSGALRIARSLHWLHRVQRWQTCNSDATLREGVFHQGMSWPQTLANWANWAKWSNCNSGWIGASPQVWNGVAWKNPTGMGAPYGNSCKRWKRTTSSAWSCAFVQWYQWYQWSLTEWLMSTLCSAWACSHHLLMLSMSRCAKVQREGWADSTLWHEGAWYSARLYHYNECGSFSIEPEVPSKVTCNVLCMYKTMGSPEKIILEVSWHRGVPMNLINFNIILIEFSIINHPFWIKNMGTPQKKTKKDASRSSGAGGIPPRWVQRVLDAVCICNEKFLDWKQPKTTRVWVSGGSMVGTLW